MDAKTNATGTSQANFDQPNVKGKSWWWVIPLILLMTAIGAGAIYYTQFQSQEKTVLTVAAGPYQSDSHTMMREVAEVVERHSDTLSLDVRATGDASRNITLLNRRNYDLATIRESTPVVANVRMIAILFPDYFQLITNRNASIRSFNDLAGKRIAVPPYGTDENRFFFIVMDHFDINVSDFQWVSVDFEQATQLLYDGKVDGFFTARSLRDARLLRFFEDAGLTGLPLSYVPVDQAKAIALKRPFLARGEIPEGAFVGSTPTPLRDRETATVNRVLVTRDDVPAAAVRELTRVMFEHRLDLTIRFALSTAISQPNAASGLTVPIHDGAQAYYDRDQPSFLQENAEPIALIITIAAMLGSGLLALRGRFTAKQKDRLDRYNYLLLEIAEEARNTNSPNTLRKLKTDLFNVLETVVRALDTDEVTEEGFQSFSLLWESVRETINDRSNELRLEKSNS